MESKNKLHILNGQVMYDHFQKTGFLKDEMMIPFNEAMCHGDTVSEIFSDEFISMRAKIHHITLADYEEITLKPLQSLFNQTFEYIELWFDEDMFCQINILTLLAWLDQIDYSRAIKLHVVDEHFRTVETFTLRAHGYHKIYNRVLLDKIMPRQVQPPPLKKGIERYLSYLDQSSDLMTFIKKHKNKPEEELLIMLLEKFGHYGLGDIQYFEIIRNHRNNPHHS